ncbi:hypothetical protein HY441_02565 [Candidatus Microgenomates bacterium]|nr:hypothetical protein [Candidatus Microgenomates bacterium]
MNELTPVTSEQAEVLKVGFDLLPAVTSLSGLFELNLWLTDAIAQSAGLELEPELDNTTRALATLVLSAELRYMDGMLGSGMIEDLDRRLNSPYGFLHRFDVLKSLLDKPRPSTGTPPSEQT